MRPTARRPRALLFLVALAVVAAAVASGLTACSATAEDRAAPGENRPEAGGSAPQGGTREGGSGDAGADARADAAKRSSFDAAGVVPAAAFIDAVDRAYCEVLRQRCSLSQTPYFDMAACLRARADGTVGPTGFQAYASAVTGGKVTYDPERAAKCFDLIAATPRLGDQSFNEQVYATCIAAFQGTIPLGGAGCKSSLECVDGFCDLASTTCKPLRAIGEACTDPNRNGDECARLGAPGASTYCAPVGGSTGTCTLTKPYFDSCTSDHECFSGLCSTSKMVGQGFYPPPITTDPYCGLADWKLGVDGTCFVQDAGGGG